MTGSAIHVNSLGELYDHGLESLVAHGSWRALASRGAAGVRRVLELMGSRTRR